MIFFYWTLKNAAVHFISFLWEISVYFRKKPEQTKITDCKSNTCAIHFLFNKRKYSSANSYFLFRFLFKKNYIRFFKAHTSIKSTFISEKIILLGIKKSVAHNNRAFLLKNMRKRNYNYGFFDPSLFSSF